MNELASKIIPLVVVGEKMLGEDKISRNRAQFDSAPTLRKPSWIRVRIPQGNAVAKLKSKLRENCVRDPITVSASDLRRYLSDKGVEKVEKLKPGKSAKVPGIDDCKLKVTRSALRSRGGMPERSIDSSFRIEPI